MVRCAALGAHNFIENGRGFGYTLGNPPCCFGGRVRGRESGPFVVKERYENELYYGLFNNKNRRPLWKWLNLRDLSKRLLPGNRSLHRIRYFTADVVERPSDREQPLRQQAYLHALSAIRELSIHKGTFLTNTKPARPVKPIPLPVDGRTIHKPAKWARDEERYLHRINS